MVPESVQVVGLLATVAAFAACGLMWRGLRAGEVMRSGRALLWVAEGYCYLAAAFFTWSLVAEAVDFFTS